MVLVGAPFLLPLILLNTINIILVLSLVILLFLFWNLSFSLVFSSLLLHSWIFQTYFWNICLHSRVYQKPLFLAQGGAKVCVHSPPPFIFSSQLKKLLNMLIPKTKKIEGFWWFLRVWLWLVSGTGRREWHLFAGGSAGVLWERRLCIC